MVGAFFLINKIVERQLIDQKWWMLTSNYDKRGSYKNIYQPVSGNVLLTLCLGHTFPNSTSGSECTDSAGHVGYLVHQLLSGGNSLFAAL